MINFFFRTFDKDAGGGSAPIQGDGSMQDAVNAMPDLLALERDDEARRPNPNPRDTARSDGREARDSNGRFKTAAEVEALARSNRDVADDVDQDADAEPDEDYVELPVEHGSASDAKPQRVKLSDVVGKYRQATKLEREIATLRSNARPMSTPEVEQAIAGIIRERQAIHAAMGQWQSMNQPVPPSIEMVNPSSPTYDPGEYHRQVSNYQTLLQAHQDVDRRRKAIEAENAKGQQELYQAKRARETALLVEAMPELATHKNAAAFRKNIKDHYGYSDEEIDATLDHRSFVVMADAIKYRELKRSADKVLREVRAKPKLVRASARQATDTRRESVSNSMGRLRQSGSLDDAAAAIGGLLNG
jgi:hypothetical protein